LDNLTDLKKFRDLFNPYVEMIDRFKTDDLSGNQLTKGNIAGGLTAVGMPEHIDYGCSALLKKAMPLRNPGRT
jgi:hypothetical protein